MIVYFRFLHGIRFQLDIDPSVTIGQIKKALRNNKVMGEKNIRILLNGKYLSDLDQVGNLKMRRTDFLLCHAEIDYSFNKSHQNSENQHEENQNEEEESPQSTLDELGISYQDAIIALGVADGSPERAAQLLYSYRRIQQSIDLLTNPIAQQEHIRHFIDQRSHVPPSQNQQNQPTNRREESNEHQQRQEQRAAHRDSTAQTQISNVPRNQRNHQQEIQHQDIISRPPRNSQNTQTQQQTQQPVQPPRRSTSNQNGTERPTLQLQQTLAFQTPIQNPPPETHQTATNTEHDSDPNSDNELQANSLIRMIREHPDKFANVVQLMEGLDRDFAMRIRENPESFLRTCNLSPENYNCEEVRFIPPEFRYLNPSIRRSIKNIIKKSGQQGLIQVMTLLQESGQSFELPVKKNPEGFIRSLGLNPRDYDCDAIRLPNSPRVGHLIDELSREEQLELIHLTNLGFSVQTVIDAFNQCNHNPEAARNLLMSQ